MPVRLTHRHVSPRPRAGFTLVELLVVIGIIAVLISVLLPSLNRANQQAKAAACLSNLRQIGAAFVMYANENRNWLPPVCNANWAAGTNSQGQAVGAWGNMTQSFYWPYFIGKYVGYKDLSPNGPWPTDQQAANRKSNIFSCTVWGNRGNDAGYNISEYWSHGAIGGYGMSPWIPPKDPDSARFASDYSGYYCPDGKFYNWGVYWTYLFAGSGNVARTAGSGKASVSRGRNAAGIVWVADGSGVNGNLGTASEYNSTDLMTKYSTDYLRHGRKPNAGLNILFGDGHAAFMNQKEAENRYKTDTFLLQ